MEFIILMNVMSVDLKDKSTTIILCNNSFWKFPELLYLVILVIVYVYIEL